MNMYVMAVYDSKAGVHSVPYYSITLGIAIRAFREAANTLDHPVCKYPEDYSLFELGMWNDETAVFTPLREPKNLGLAATYKKQE